jgi:biotin carboxylase
MKRILIINRGLSAFKYLLSIKEWTGEPLTLVRFVTPEDIESGFRHVELSKKSVYL